MLFKFMSKAVEGIVGQITQQLKGVQDSVESPITKLVGEITGGAWQGEDADAMSDEITKVVIPMVADLIAAIGGMSTNITQAAKNIQDADKKALDMVEDLVGDFASIF